MERFKSGKEAAAANGAVKKEKKGAVSGMEVAPMKIPLLLIPSFSSISIPHTQSFISAPKFRPSIAPEAVPHLHCMLNPTARRRRPRMTRR
jgi:hypothetical protein